MTLSPEPPGVVSDETIEHFGAASEDRNPVHFDDGYAAELAAASFLHWEELETRLAARRQVAFRELDLNPETPHVATRPTMASPGPAIIRPSFTLGGTGVTYSGSATVLPGPDGNPEIAAGFGTTSLDEPFDALDVDVRIRVQSRLRALLVPRQAVLERRLLREAYAPFDLQAGPVQRVHHRLELADLPAGNRRYGCRRSGLYPQGTGQGRAKPGYRGDGRGRSPPRP